MIRILLDPHREGVIFEINEVVGEQRCAPVILMEGLSVKKAQKRYS
jgi:hypothetical protein